MAPDLNSLITSLRSCPWCGMGKERMCVSEGEEVGYCKEKLMKQAAQALVVMRENNETYLRRISELEDELKKRQ